MTKRPLEQVFLDDIFSKLGMNDTYLPVSKKEHIPQVYYGKTLLDRPQFIISSKASGGCVSTIKDLMLFIRAFFQGKLFDDSLFETFEKYKPLQLSMFPIQYGGGFMRIKMGGLATLFQGQGELIGHSGSTGSFAFYYPQKDLFFAGDFNQMKHPALPIKYVMQLAMFASK